MEREHVVVSYISNNVTLIVYVTKFPYIFYNSRRREKLWLKK